MMRQVNLKQYFQLPEKVSEFFLLVGRILLLLSPFCFFSMIKLFLWFTASFTIILHIIRLFY